MKARIDCVNILMFRHVQICEWHHLQMLCSAIQVLTDGGESTCHQGRFRSQRRVNHTPSFRVSMMHSQKFKNRTVTGIAPPSFKTAWCMELYQQEILSCNYGYTQQNGIPCDHLFCVEDAYGLEKISPDSYSSSRGTPNILSVYRRSRT